MIIKHTKGEWNVDLLKIRTSKKIIAESFGNRTGFNVPKFEEARANAKLIAAAPELLQGLIDCRQAMIHTKRFTEKSF